MARSYRNSAAFAMLALAIGISSPALGQERQPAAGPQPSPSAGAANGSQGGAQSTPSNNQASNPPANNNSGASQPATQEVQTVTGDLVPGYDPIAMTHTETVTRLENRDHNGGDPEPSQFRLVQGTKDGTPYAYAETTLTLRGVVITLRYPVHELEVLRAGTSTTMYAITGSFGDRLLAVPADAKPSTRARNEDALKQINLSKSDQDQKPPEEKKESLPPGPSPQGGGQGARIDAKSGKAGALEDNNKSNNNKSDNNNRENRTERDPAGHSGKPAATPTKLQQAVAATEAGKTDRGSNSQAHEDKIAQPPGPAGKPASAPAKSPLPAKLTEFDTSHMGVASKKTDSALAKAHEAAPLTKLDTSHLGTASSNNAKPASAPLSIQQVGKLAAFDTSHMGVAARLQSLSKPALPITARTLANPH